jgi:hypothetical protein
LEEKMTLTIKILLMVLGLTLGFSSLALSAPLVIEKNLFSPERKPNPDEPAAATAQQGNRPSVALNTIQLDGVIVRGDTKRALVRLKGQARGRNREGEQIPYTTVQEGEQIADFRVVKIDFNNISLEKNGEVHVIRLFAENKVVTPIPAAPAPPTDTPPGAQPASARGQAPRAPGDRRNAPQPPPQPGGIQELGPGNVGEEPFDQNASLPPPAGGQPAPAAVNPHRQPAANMAPADDMEDDGDMEE